MRINEELNYKEICKELNDNEVGGGRNREQQLARWQKEYEVEKIGRGKYVIKRELTPSERQYIKDTDNYFNYLQATLLNMIAEDDRKGVKVYYTYRQIREHLMMVNSRYFPIKYQMREKFNKFDIDCPFGYDEDIMQDFQREWFGIADSHDENLIKKALRRLNDKHLIILSESFVFYKFEKAGDGQIVYHPPVLATEQQLAEFQQIQLDFLKSQGKKGLNELFCMPKSVVKQYFITMNGYVNSLGYDRYARAFVVIRPTELKRVANYFAPTFNMLQVDRYLTSKRFKSIPPFIHNQMTTKLIKKG